MKTTTILKAYEGVLHKRHMGFAHSRRQRDKLRAALLARIEAGDRARDAMQQIIDILGPTIMLSAAFGTVDETTQNIVDVLSEYLEPQP